MNWSHALLVVAIGCAAGSFVTVVVMGDMEHQPALFVVSAILLTLATISGALAAGLWR